MKSVFGRYIPGESFLYKIDPRLKILLVVFFVVFAFMNRSLLEMFILLVPLLIAYLITVKRFYPLIKMIKFPLFVAIIILIVNIFTISGEDILLSQYGQFIHDQHYVGANGLITKELGRSISLPESFQAFNAQNLIDSKVIDNSEEFDKILTIFKNSVHSANYIWYLKFKPDYEGLKLTISLFHVNKSLALFVRIYMMVLATSLLTNTTRPILLTKAIEDLMFPLKLFFVPTQIIAMIISIALRFIPTLLDESQRIMKAQSARGVDFKNGTIKDKVTSFTTLIIPLFVSSFAKADDLSDAMQTRGYDPYKKRTKYRHLSFGIRDLILTVFFIALGAFFVINNYYPSIATYLPDIWHTWFMIA
ncbi:energy-coupling factor transporter transmembrane component T family protein [Mycoplasmopsis sturni]|uniref:energy-coupling factor transporter transmembrane component T family protein n=1 Tax=Mycoplasmopsis sturni TaxID=39047 RepID=UPI00056ADD4F|nr:energy-coupling factor transporter transmembrane component T [Mycoplasmopsis sturni]